MDLQETRLVEQAAASGRQPARGVKSVTLPPNSVPRITMPRPVAHPHANRGALAVGSLHFDSVACIWRSTYPPDGVALGQLAGVPEGWLHAVATMR